MEFIDVGNGNYVARSRIITVASPKSVNRVIDVSCGKKTKSVILTDSEHVVLSALETDALAKALNGGADGCRTDC